jgi:pimeloyl-ACP methyl ester carboxylesterase
MWVGQIKPVHEQGASSKMFKTAAGEAEFMACYDASLAEWPVAYASLRVPTRYGATHVIACGPEDGPTLVLLHAAGTSSTVWLRNVAAVSHTYRTFLVDIVDEPSKSEWSGPLRSRSDSAEWLSDVLDGLKIDCTHLGGMSRGAWLSLNYALAAPNRVKSLMLLAPGGSFTKFRLSFFVHFLFPMFFPTRARLHRTIQWLSATGQVVDERLVDQMFLAVKHFQFPKGGIYPTVFSDAELRRLRLPTLLLVGDHEVLYDPTSALDRAVRLIPGIRAELIADAGHLLIMEQPEIVNGRMVEFLESTGL